VGAKYILVDDAHRTAYVLGKGGWWRDPETPGHGGVFERGDRAAAQECYAEVEERLRDELESYAATEEAFVERVTAEVLGFLCLSGWKARFIDDTRDELEVECRYRVVGSRDEGDEDVGRMLAPCLAEETSATLH
jgi:hypothetical protein